MRCMKESNDELRCENQQLCEKMESQNKQLCENEKLYRSRLEMARGELEALHNELCSRKEVIRNANEAIFNKVTFFFCI